MKYSVTLPVERIAPLRLEEYFEPGTEVTIYADLDYCRSQGIYGCEITDIEANNVMRLPAENAVKEFNSLLEALAEWVILHYNENFETALAAERGERQVDESKLAGGA